MADPVLEIENISSGGDDLETDHEPPAAGIVRPISNTATAGLEETLAPTQPAPASSLTIPLENRAPSRAPSTSARVLTPRTETVESLPISEGATASERIMSLDTEPSRTTTTGGDGTEEPFDVQGTQHPRIPVRPINQERRPSLVSQANRNVIQREPVGVQRTQQPQIPVQPISEDETQRRPSLASQASRNVIQREPVRQPIIEESPPLYAHLFPPNGGSCAHNTQPTQHNVHHMSSPTTLRHPQPMSWNQCGHQCHTCYPYTSHHHPHTSIPLPGGIGHPSHHDHTSRHHSTVLPTVLHGSQRNVQDTADDYIKLSFVCVILCTLHLNLPALFCVLPALAYSIMAQKLTVEGRYRKARKYSRAALTCNLIAFCQYIVLIVIIAAVVAFVVIGIQITL